jgi:hypothetical protein
MLPPFIARRRDEIEYELRDVVRALTMQEGTAVIEGDGPESALILRGLSELSVDEAVDGISRAREVQGGLAQC